MTYHVCLGIFDQICWAFAFFHLIPKKIIVVGLGNLPCQYQEVSIVALIVGINRFSADNQQRCDRLTDGQTGELIWVGLGSLRLLQVYFCSLSTHQETHTNNNTHHGQSPPSSTSSFHGSLLVRRNCSQRQSWCCVLPLSPYCFTPSSRPLVALAVLHLSHIC
jgi:hypothetical protein